MDQALQGNIGRFTLPEIFQLVAAGRKSGTLGIQRDEDIVMVYFKEGKIIYGFGPRKTFHLGQLLRDRGRITSEQLEEAVAAQAKSSPSLRLGQILIEKGFIHKGDLEKIVKEQVEELVYSLLSWETGTFKFYEKQYPTDEEIMVDISVENAILEGYRRIDELNRVREALPDFDEALQIAPAPANRKTDISLQSEEWNLLSLVDGRRSIEEIAERSDMSRVDTLRKLAALKLAGLVVAGEPRKDGEADRLEFMVKRISRLLEDYLEHKSHKVQEKTSIQPIDLPASRLSETDMVAQTEEEN